MKKIIFTFSILVFSLLSVSCGKRTKVEGTVFSKHEIPVANAIVQIEIYTGKDYPDHSVGSTKTDKNGFYSLPFRFSNNRAYKVFCSSDSGTFRSPYLEKGVTQTVDMHFK